MRASGQFRVSALNRGSFRVDRHSAQSVGLVGWWPLAVQGGSAEDRDYSGYKNNGTRTNTPTRQPAHIRNWGGVTALDMQASDYVDVSHVAPLRFGASNWTWTFWVQSHLQVTNTSYYLINTRGTPAATANYLAINYRNNVFRAFFQNTAASGFSDTLNTYAINVFHHVAVVRDNSQPKLSIYVNAVDDTNVNTALSAAYNIDNSNSYVFGSGKDATLDTFDGLMKDIRVYDRALSADLISQIYAEPWRIVKPLGEQGIGFVSAAAGTILPQVTAAYFGASR